MNIPNHMSRQNILEIIAEHEAEIHALKAELSLERSSRVKKSIQFQIDNIEDNCYRYKLQAQAWGLMK